jgi:methylphosphotriester-DNA--protein-cysteine methyltransferase
MIQKIITEIQQEVDKLDVTDQTQNAIAEGLLTAKRIAEKVAGVTYLDSFAAKAMPEIMRQMRDVHKGNDGTITESSYPIAAEYSYKLAAAMLEERKKYITHNTHSNEIHQDRETGN